MHKVWLDEYKLYYIKEKCFKSFGCTKLLPFATDTHDCSLLKF